MRGLSFGTCLCSGSAQSLGFHVAFHRLKAGVADASRIVGPMPEERLPVESPQMVCVLRANAPGTGRLEVIDQHGNLKGRMDVYQQMHMIRLAAKLQE